MNGVGTGKQVVMTLKQKEAVNQLVPRRGLAASAAVVIGMTILTTVQFLSVAAAALSAAAPMAFVLCVPLLNKINMLL